MSTQAVVMDEPKLVSLAREIAMNILPLPHVLSKLGLTHLDLELVKTHPRFIHLLEQMSAEWGSTLNTSERVKVKSQALIEDSLPEVYHLLHDRKESFAAKVEALKMLRQLGGLADRDVGSAGAFEHFRLEIHIGDGKPNIIDVTPGVMQGGIPGPQNLRGGTRPDPIMSYAAETNSELAGGIE